MESDSVTAAPTNELADLQAVIANQKALGRRLVWLMTVPLVITAVIVFFFFRLSARLTDVEVGEKLLATERLLLTDGQNYAWAADQYEQIAQTYQSAPVLARLGTLYFFLGRKDQALEKLQMAERLDPNYWETYRSLTYIYTVGDEPKEAIEAGKKALAMNEFDANTYNNLAWTYATSNDPAFHDLQLAQKYAERAVKLTEETQPYFLDTLGEVYFLKGGADNLSAARHWIRKAIDVASNVDRPKFQDHFKELFPDEAPR